MLHGHGAGGTGGLMGFRFRRVVTTTDAGGASHVLRDATVDPTDYRIVQWFTQRTTDALRDPPSREFSGLPLNPPVGATTFQFIMVPPDSPEVSWEELDAFYGVAFAGTDTVRGNTRRHPGMHRTATIDYIIVLQGELTMLLSQEEVVLLPFDTVIQRGTEHAWCNRGSVPALFAAVTIDLSVAGVSAPGTSSRLEFAAMYGLTPSEVEVAIALASGSSLKTIAAQRRVSINTVRTHLSHLRSKLGVRSQAEVLRITMRHLGFIVEQETQPPLLSAE